MSKNPPRTKRFTTLKRMVLPFIKAYQNDLLVIDKEYFDKYPDTDFLLFFRPYGTHLLTYQQTEEMEKKKSEATAVSTAILYTKYNNAVVHGTGGKYGAIKMVSFNEAKDIAEKWTQKARKALSK